MPCRALEEMKGDDIIAVEKSLESEAWAQLWTLRITHLQSGKLLAQRLTPGGTWQAGLRMECFLTAAAWVKHLLDMLEPLARGTCDCLSRDPALLRAPPSRHSLCWEGGALSGHPATVAVLLLFPQPPLCGPASQASYALYTEFGHRLPVSDGRCPPSTMPEVFPQPWRGALTEGWGRRAPFPSHSSWPGSLCGHRALLPSPCPLGDIGADLHVTTSVGLGELYKH